MIGIAQITSFFKAHAAAHEAYEANAPRTTVEPAFYVFPHDVVTALVTTKYGLADDPDTVEERVVRVTQTDIETDTLSVAWIDELGAHHTERVSIEAVTSLVRHENIGFGDVVRLASGEITDVRYTDGTQVRLMDGRWMNIARVEEVVSSYATDDNAQAAHTTEAVHAA